MSRPGILFSPPGADLARGLKDFEQVLARVVPLKAKHRAALPGGIRLLSEQLTVERDDLAPDYMARPESLSAYLNWFLPWNLYRQGLLLQGLGLDLPEGARIVDLGAGPLTFGLAAWLALPALRERKLTYVALDRAEPALKTGRDLLAAVAGEQAGAWDVQIQRALAGRMKTPPADLLVAANFLNELEVQPRGRRSGRRTEPELEESAFGDREAKLLAQWEKSIGPDGALLLIEPGTRPAGRALTRLRIAALQRGWQVAAPCPHQVECPQPGIRGLPWCHFTFSSDAAPDWLRALARQVKLPKERASLSFLLLTRPASRVRIAPAPRTGRGESLCLVASEPFELPGRGNGRYGCSERGLVLLEEKGPARGGPQPGDTLVVRWPESPRRDPKSGAIVLPRSEPPAPQGKPIAPDRKPPRRR